MPVRVEDHQLASEFQVGDQAAHDGGRRDTGVVDQVGGERHDRAPLGPAHGVDQDGQAVQPAGDLHPDHLHVGGQRGDR
ncbi:hypothetical protein TH66_00575 [Carbonactinospora thermoautotrophica]|uniref:Uncharacterized protein n=1 Tax=Carbonactinospora thermoautotrophica TaxID=1469144 RepID=A0A132N6Y4_9ACTN|nr:hypothetical protein [Carbonactinospora thermoautotrophica]KWX05864.1 hypothetical protein TH66_00575 [Carbonactinospora thermoautotrophica]